MGTEAPAPSLLRPRRIPGLKLCGITSKSLSHFGIETEKPTITQMKKNIFVFLALLSSSICILAQTLSNYQAAVASQSPNFYFTFDSGSLSSVTGSATLNAAAGMTNHAYDLFGNPNNVAIFSASGDTLVGNG